MSLLVVLALLLVGGAVSPTMSSFSGTTVNPAGNFSAAATFPTPCGPARPAFWLSGLEHGVLAGSNQPNLFTTLTTDGGSIALDSTVKRSGNHSIKLTDTDGSNAVAAEIDTAYLATRILNLRFALRFETLPSANVSDIVKFKQAVSDPKFGYNSSTKKLQIKMNSTAAALSTVSAGVWYVIDIRWNTSANPNTFEWRIDGVDQPTNSEAITATDAEGFMFGGEQDADTFNVNFDDIIVTTGAGDYPIGDGGILSLAPNAMGTITNPNSYLKDNATTTNIGATSWQLLDETPMTSRADYIRQTTASTANYARVAFEDPGAGCINAVGAVVAMHSSATGSNQAKTSVFEGTTETVVHNDDVSPGTGASEYRAAVVNPTGGSWDTAKLTGLQAQIGAAANTGSQPRWDALRIEYDVAAG